METAFETLQTLVCCVYYVLIKGTSSPYIVLGDFIRSRFQHVKLKTVSVDLTPAEPKYIFEISSRATDMKNFCTPTEAKFNRLVDFKSVWCRLNLREALSSLKLMRNLEFVLRSSRQLRSTLDLVSM